MCGLLLAGPLTGRWEEQLQCAAGARRTWTPCNLLDGFAGRQSAVSSAPKPCHPAPSSLTGWEGAAELGGVVHPGTLFPCLWTHRERNSLGLYGRSLGLHSCTG